MKLQLTPEQKAKFTALHFQVSTAILDMNELINELEEVEGCTDENGIIEEMNAASVDLSKAEESLTLVSYRI